MLRSFLFNPWPCLLTRKNETPSVVSREAFKAQLKSERSKHARSGAAATAANVDLVLNTSCHVAVFGSAVSGRPFEERIWWEEGKEGMEAEALVADCAVF
jgi:hypothetical protein